VLARPRALAIAGTIIGGSVIRYFIGRDMVVMSSSSLSM